MAKMPSSFIQFPWFILIILAITIINRSAGESSKIIPCSQPDSFTAQITENEHVVVYDTELLIRYNPEVKVSYYPKVNTVNVVFNESIIEFKGYMLPQYSIIQSDISPKTLYWSSSGAILGIGALQKPSYKDYIVNDCHLVLPTDVKDRVNIPTNVEDEIIYYIHSCIKAYICQDEEIIETEESESSISTSLVPENSPKKDTCSGTASNGGSNLNINVPVDIALSKAVKYIKDSDQSVIKIPDMQQTHLIGPFKTKCHFEAINGTFQDLSTLQRTEDAVMSNVEKTYVIQAGVGLSTALFKYDYYKLKFGLITVSGEILGTVNKLALGTKVVIDYSETCAVNLEYIKVTQIGKIKLKMTGLGLLNNLTSKLLTWITKTWKDDIVKLIENNLRDIAEKHLSKYICKHFENANIQ